MTTEGRVMTSQISASSMPRSGRTGPVSPTSGAGGEASSTRSGKEVSYAGFGLLRKVTVYSPGAIFF